MNASLYVSNWSIVIINEYKKYALVFQGIILIQCYVNNLYIFNISHAGKTYHLENLTDWDTVTLIINAKIAVQLFNF